MLRPEAHLCPGVMDAASESRDLNLLRVEFISGADIKSRSCLRAFVRRARKPPRLPRGIILIPHYDIIECLYASIEGPDWPHAPRDPLISICASCKFTRQTVNKSCGRSIYMTLSESEWPATCALKRGFPYLMVPSDVRL